MTFYNIFPIIFSNYLLLLLLPAMASAASCVLLLFSVAATLCICASAHPLSPVYDRVVFVGDSASDSGNVYTLTGGAWPPSVDWSEYFAQEIGASLTNMAYGGATSSNAYVQGYTGPNSTIPVPCKLDFLI